MRLLRLAATTAAALTLVLLGHATAWADEVTPSTPSASASDDSMSDMDMGSMPGMDHDTTPMPSTEHEHGSTTTPSSRPRALVLGGFVLVNGTGMVTALVLRRRSRHERDRKRRAKQQAGTPSIGSAAATAAAVRFEGASR